jgi:EF-P beta-lysylation protein EpmB
MSGHSTLIALQEEHSWQQQLQEAIRTPDALAEALHIPLEDLPYSSAAHDSFPLLVPRAFAARMRRGDPQDPLLRQVLAIEQENDELPGYSDDPVAEISTGKANPGVLQKYSGRALLILTGQCAINCRYCFRRHYPYSEAAASSSQRLRNIDALLADESIGEIILSGGDPLLLPDSQLASISDRIAEHATPRTLRIHTRLPIVIPDRVSSELLEALSRPGLRCVVVLHSNHPQEIDQATAQAIGRLRDAGLGVLNQSVLLAGINDDAQTLAALSDRLFAAGAMPYYLHILDRVSGAAHFAVCRQRARRLVGELAEMRPGYLVPRLMVEVAGAGSKRELAPIYSDCSE